MIFSRKAFRIVHQGRSGLLYKEPGRHAQIDCEFYSDPLGICLYCVKWRWSDGSDFSEEETQYVLDRLIAYHSQRGYEVTQFQDREHGDNENYINVSRDPIT